MGARSFQSMSLFTLAWAATLAACDDGSNKLQGHTNAQSAFSGPQFPGTGTGSAGQSLAAGLDTVTCDGRGQAPGGSQGPAPGATAERLCFFSDDAPKHPAAMVEWIVESATDQELVHVRLTLNPAFADNTYGATAIGWELTRKGRHTFKDLVGSDHAEFKLYDNEDTLALHFKLDYLSEDAAAPSGYATQGVTDGEGKMLLGSPADIVAASTSLDRNLNACGLEYLVDSPATDADYTPNPAAPHWDFRVVYDVWVKQEVFASSGFGRAIVDFVHASPSKLGENTVEVTPGECPPDWPYCDDPAGCECTPSPDDYCGSTPPSCVGAECADAGQGDGEPIPDLF